MWAWAKAAAVLGLSVLLMGSKIIIQVPEGGSIASSSGLFACSAGEICTIEINERHFAETFTAVAAPGYQFHSWGDKAGVVCRGSHDPYCDELDSDEFSDGQGGTVKIPRGSVLSMTPSFTSDASPIASTQPQFSIRSLHTTRYYEVHGNTQEEVWAELLGTANPLADEHHGDRKPVAHADFHYQYNFDSEPGAAPSSCRVAQGKLNFKFETVLPQLAFQKETSEHLRYRWQSFQAQVTEHEAGHHVIYRQLVTQLPELMTNIGEAPCTELAETVELAVAGAVQAVRRASVDYDQYYSSEAYLTSSR